MSLMCKLEDYKRELLTQERAEATISKYIHDVRAFLVWSESQNTGVLTKVQVLRWRDEQAQGSAPATVNAAVAAVNGFLRFIGRGDCCVRPLRVQRTLYRERRLELTREEYFRLLRAAEQVSEQTVACWKPSVPRASALVNCGISLCKLSGKASRRCETRASAAPSCYPEDCRHC